MRKINKIILHHSFTKDQKVVDFDAIKRYHINEKKWADIGYHYLVELVGSEYKILKGRDESVIGVHTAGENTNSIGICLVGNFDATVPPGAQLNKLAELIRELNSRYGKLSIHAHNEYSTKSCPGKLFPMQKVKDMVNGIASQPTLSLNKIGIVTASPSLNVRQGAGVQFKKIGVLQNGEEVKVVSQNDNWFEIEYGTGYVHKDYIKFKEDEIPQLEVMYELQGTTHILKADPLDLGITIQNKAIKNIPHRTAVNGTFFWAGQPNGIIINDGKILGENASHAWRGYPQSVIYCNKQGKVFIGRYKLASEFNLSNVAWAIGGLGILTDYGYSPDIEGFSGVYSDVLRTTTKTFMGYKSSENKIYICVRPSSSHDRIIQSCKNLGLNFAISLDGGGSSSIKIDGDVKVSGDGRPVNNYLYIK